ncbi:MAG: pyridoxal-phosphate dependent enzyme [Deltaproteobacteria bacterium]|nr:pyridoxal-phosphate dependent enzyme [Deltaproteobacteria bacterium]
MGAAAETAERFRLRRTGSGETYTWREFVEAYRSGVFQAEADVMLEVDFDYGFIRQSFGRAALSCEAPGIFAAWPLLPLGGPHDLVSLGEGSTPLIRTRRREDGVHAYIKNEAQNPTGSFKDRYDCVSVNVARRMGYRRVACASTGNHALAVAAYAAAAGMSCVAIVSDRASPQVLATLKAYGAETLVVPPAGRFEELGRKAKEGCFPVGLHMPGPTGNPFGVEGYKTIAYEIHRQLGKAPDAVVFPCARGNGLYGTWKGCLELKTLGLADALPRMYACQPEAAASLVKAYETGADGPVLVEARDTVADATCEAISSRAALDAIRASGGGAIALGEEEIIAAMLALARTGIFAEPSSAMAWAGMEELIRRGEIRGGEEAVVVVTSTGFKTGRATLDRITGEEAAGGAPQGGRKK